MEFLLKVIDVATGVSKEWERLSRKWIRKDLQVVTKTKREQNQIPKFCMMKLGIRMWGNQSEAGREGILNIRNWEHHMDNVQEEANRVISLENVCVS